MTDEEHLTDPERTTDRGHRPRHATASVAEQSEEERGGPDSILSRQSRDHADLDALMTAYDRTADAGERARIVAELADRALRHAFAEETVLFPAYRRYLGDDEQLTAHIEGDHQFVNDALQQLQSADPADPDYDRTVRRTFEVIRHDAHDEEDDLLPRLQQVAGVEELRAIGGAWEVQRRVAPTRPHPDVPRRPPGNVLASLPLAVSDRAKDVVTGTSRLAAARRGRVALAGALVGAVLLVRAVRRR